MEHNPDLPKRDYDVGFGKPPEHTRYRKGQSGNPSGRPKTPGNLAQLLQRKLCKKIVIEENGHRRRVTKLEAIADQLVSRATAGDPSAIRQVLKLQPAISEKQKPLVVVLRDL